MSDITVGQIASQLNEPMHRVQHVLNTRDIAPTRRVGILRMFDQAALERVRDELRAIDAKRNRRASRQAVPA